MKTPEPSTPEKSGEWLQRDSNPCFSHDHVFAKSFSQLQRSSTPNPDATKTRSLKFLKT